MNSRLIHLKKRCPANILSRSTCKGDTYYFFRAGIFYFNSFSMVLFIQASCFGKSL